MTIATAKNDDVPRSVQRLWHEAQISHQNIPAATAILKAIKEGDTNDNERGRIGLGLAIQEVTETELVDLMIESVIEGRELHYLLASLNATGHIRRLDLVEWSEMFA